MLKTLRHLAMYGVLMTGFAGALLAMAMIPAENREPEPGSPAETGPPPKRVDAIELEPRPFVETILTPGVIEAIEDVTLGASIPGIVEAIEVREGERVREGQTLFQIDLRERKARLEEARSVDNLAQKNLERYKTLFEKGNVTRKDYDEAVARAEQTAAALKLAQVAVSLGVVKAPIAGIVDRIHADEGEYVHEGTELARLMDISKVEVVMGVPERHADAVSREREALVMIEGLEEEFPASVGRVAYGGDLSTNTYETTIVLDNPDERIRPGMIAKTRLVTRKIDDAILVPLPALIRTEAGMSVFAVEDETAIARPVEVGGIRGDHAEIRAGLEAGDLVVVTGQRDLVDGQRVRIMQRVPQTLASPPEDLAP